MADESGSLIQWAESEPPCFFTTILTLIDGYERDVTDAAARLGIDPSDALEALYGSPPTDDELASYRESVRAEMGHSDACMIEAFAQARLRYHRFIDAGHPEACRNRSARQTFLLFLIGREIARNQGRPVLARFERGRSPLAQLVQSDLTTSARPRARGEARRLPRSRRRRQHTRCRSPGRPDRPTNEPPSSGEEPA